MCRPVRRPLRVKELENRCKELERENNFLRGMNRSLTWVPKEGYDELEKANKALMGEVEYLRKRLVEANKNYKLCKAVSTRSGRMINAIRDILEGEV